MASKVRLWEVKAFASASIWGTNKSMVVRAPNALQALNKARKEYQLHNIRSIVLLAEED